MMLNAEKGGCLIFITTCQSIIHSSSSLNPRCFVEPYILSRRGGEMSFCIAALSVWLGVVSAIPVS